MRPLRCGEFVAKLFSQSSNSAVKTAPKMVGTETMAVEMMPTVVVLGVVSSDNELASVVWSASAVVWTVIRAPVNTRHIICAYVVTSPAREEQYIGRCPKHQ